MKKLTPRQYAELLYELVRDAKRADIAPRVAAFARFLVRRRATLLLPRILSAFGDFWDEREGIIRVRLVSARKIPEKIRAELAKALGAKKLEVEAVIDPELIGGLRLKFQDTIIDGTVKTQLKNLQSALSK